ncbi:MAG: hypothetical protein WCZ90_01240 [Melioribacteraceae bacterium]
MKLQILLFFLIINISCSYLPPTRKETLSKSNFQWKTDSTKHYIFYYEQYTITPNYVDSTKLYYERGFNELLNYLGVSSNDKKYNVFLVSTNERMELLVGRKTNGAAHPDDGTFYTLLNQNKITFDKHEACHVIASSEWGRGNEAWISEGLAVGSNGAWWSYELHSLAKYLHQKDKLVPIKELIRNFHSYNNLITYPESGSFIIYIKERYGLKFIKSLYKEGAIAIENQLNKSISIIESEWLNEIKKYDSAKILYEEKVIKYGANL